MNQEGNDEWSEQLLAQPVIRRQFRAATQQEKEQTELETALAECANQMEHLKCQHKILTCGCFQYQEMIFVYMEQVGDFVFDPEVELRELQKFLCQWPEHSGNSYWIEMIPVFWFDSPKTVGQWRRQIVPDQRCARIAFLYPQTAMDYVYHHQAIVREGLLIGDRYQSIAIHENILFSYFETPRDREQVNIRRSPEASQEIKNWEGIDPDSHFIHLPEANGANFLVIPTLFNLG